MTTGWAIYLEVTGHEKKHVRGRAEWHRRQKWPKQGGYQSFFLPVKQSSKAFKAKGADS